MPHFETEEWVDFVRGLGEPKKREAIEEHLASGCRECRTDSQLWEQVHSTGNRAAEYEPPSRLVQSVKAMMVTPRVEALPSPFSVLAELVTDSFLLPAPVGVRSTGVAPRRLLYRAKGMHIDLRVEQVPRSSRVSVVGQVMDLSTTGQAVSNLPVLVVGEKGEVLLQTITTAIGEFLLEFELSAATYLTVRLMDDREILLPLEQFGPSSNQR